MGLCSKIGAGSLEIVNYLTPLCTNPIKEAAPSGNGLGGRVLFQTWQTFHGKLVSPFLSALILAIFLLAIAIEMVTL